MNSITLGALLFGTGFLTYYFLKEKLILSLNQIDDFGLILNNVHVEKKLSLEYIIEASIHQNITIYEETPNTKYIECDIILCDIVELLSQIFTETSCTYGYTDYDSYTITKLVETLLVNKKHIVSRIFIVNDNCEIIYNIGTDIDGYYPIAIKLSNLLVKNLYNYELQTPVIHRNGTKSANKI